MGRVHGKIALVTGGAGGIGRAIAQRLAENGAKIVIADLAVEAGEHTAAELRRGGADIVFIHHDVSNEESWSGAIGKTMQAYGKLDVLVNSAGIFSDVGQPFDAITFGEWRRIMSINLDGVFLGTRSGVRCMKATGGGSIINIASTASYIGTKAGAAYGASKGGVRVLTIQAAFSCAKHAYNIRVNSISPGYVWTPAIEAKVVADVGSRSAALEAVASRNPLGLVAEPDDVAWAAVYLASDESRMITATDLVIDGGMLRS